MTKMVKCARETRSGIFLNGRLKKRIVAVFIPSISDAVPLMGMGQPESVGMVWERAKPLFGWAKLGVYYVMLG